MTDRWLTLADAARLVGRSVRTVKAWRQQGEITVIVGRVRESDVVAAKARISGRVGGRPAAETSATSAR